MTEPDQTTFAAPDLVPLWNRPPEFLPLRPPGSAHRWSFGEVRAELERVGRDLDPTQSERRVALLAHPDLSDAMATDGLHAGIQMLLPGERAAAHRHTPAALRVGLLAEDTYTFVDDQDLRLGPLDVVLNPSGTWHGHEDRADSGAFWLDVVDLPIPTALGGVLFEPTAAHRTGDLLDPPSVPDALVFPWAEQRERLHAGAPVRGVRTLRYGSGEVMPTLAVTAHALDADAVLDLPRRTGGAIVLVGDGSCLAASDDGGGFDRRLDRFDIVALRAWTGLRLTATEDSIVLVVDTSPALAKLGLHRSEPTGS